MAMASGSQKLDWPAPLFTQEAEAGGHHSANRQRLLTPHCPVFSSSQPVPQEILNVCQGKSTLLTQPSWQTLACGPTCPAPWLVNRILLGHSWPCHVLSLPVFLPGWQRWRAPQCETGRAWKGYTKMLPSAGCERWKGRRRVRQGLCGPTPHNQPTTGGLQTHTNKEIKRKERGMRLY